MKTQVVSFHCVLKDKLGKVLGSTFNHEVIAQSDGQGSMLQGLVDGLQDLHKGEKRSIFVPAEKAYGFYDQRLLVEVLRKEFSFGKRIKMNDEVLYPDFEGNARTFRVIKISADSILIDANHALAGQDLIFDIEATEARDATAADTEDETPSAKGFLH